MEQGIDPFGPTATQVASFLFSLFETLASHLNSHPHKQGRVGARQNYLGHEKFYGIKETQAYASTARVGSEHCSGGLRKTFLIGTSGDLS